MNPTHLMQRIRLGEDSTLELKQITFKDGKNLEPHPDGLSDELAAMGNASGGLMVLGVNPDDEQLYAIPLDMLKRLFQQRSQARIVRFEEQIVPKAHFDDLDALLLRRFIKADQGDVITQLARLHLIDNRDGEALPTIAGVLLCTLDPSRWLRNAEILAVAHSGLRNDPNEQLDAQEIRGPLDRQILDAFHFVRRNMITAARKPLGRVDYPQYHLGAVFEAIVNAVAHRDYSLHAQRIRLFMFADRLEIHSPGALPNTLSLESMSRLSVPRNEILASLFSRYYPVDEVGLGKSYLMDRRGFGVEMILRESEKISGKCPRYETISDLELSLTLYAQTLPTAETP